VIGYSQENWDLTPPVSRLALRPIQPPIELVPGVLSQGVKLTMLFHPVLRLRICIYEYSSIYFHNMVLKYVTIHVYSSYSQPG
jgi:hypothetical protein